MEYASCIFPFCFKCTIQKIDTQFHVESSILFSKVFHSFHKELFKNLNVLEFSDKSERIIVRQKIPMKEHFDSIMYVH